MSPETARKNLTAADVKAMFAAEDSSRAAAIERAVAVERERNQRKGVSDEP